MTQIQQLGRYQLLRVLGRGAMGLVYEASDPKLNRRVAIKVIQTSRIDDPAVRAEYSARFIQEAQAVARLNHPNIVTVYDFGEENGIAYLVMELIAGEELGSYFDDSQAFSLDFTLEDSVRMTCELLDAVGYAHQMGIIHRDIKPANVMLGAQLLVKLTDFGVARLQDVNTNHTEAGTMVGTPSYMSPEQIAGQAVGPRSDIFAVGIILYQFLTSEKPFQGTGLFALQQKIMYEQPTLPSVRNPLISPMFDRIVLRALAKRPEDRYPTARSFKEDLRRALSGETIDLDDTMPPGARDVNPFLAQNPAAAASGASGGTGKGYNADSSTGGVAAKPAPGDDPDATRISGTGLPFPSAPDDDATVVTGLTTPPGRQP
ncbi:serine/threonine protein kinase [Oxalobacteraceae bacterium]|nr:serine/threonine protein kinase [Oxalobacteraceae bacterium]